MKKIFYCMLALISVSFGYAFAQQPLSVQNDYAIRDLEAQTRRNIQEAEQLRMETERLRSEMRIMESTQRTRDILNDMELKREPSFLEKWEKERAENEARKKAEQLAEDQRHQIAVASAQSRNQTIYFSTFIALVGVVLLIIKQRNKAEKMDENKKSGILVMTIATVLPLTSLLFNVYPWVDEHDILSNLFQASIIIGDTYDPLAKFPLSWLIFAAVLFFAYGFLVFTNVTSTPSWLRKFLKDRENAP